MQLIASVTFVDKHPLDAGGLTVTRRSVLPLIVQGYRNLRLDPRDLIWVAPDLEVPALVDGEPRPGYRVRLGSPERYHVLFLPDDWVSGRSYPLIVEYPCNGPGPLEPYIPGISKERGIPEDTMLGYGLSAGQGFLWLCLPFLGPQGLATSWWGDIHQTVDYCRRTVEDVCLRFGGDPRRILLCGFSRGSIACNYVGLRDDSIAGLWRAFFCHSHYDGVHRWDYSDSDRESALARLERLKGRPQFITHENAANAEGWTPADTGPSRYMGSVEETRRYIESTGSAGDFTCAPLPYPNHTAAWILRPLPLRAQVRRWAHQVLEA